MNNLFFGKLKLWGADVQRRAKGAEVGKKMRHREKAEGRGEFALLRHLLCLPDRHRVKVSTRKEKTMVVLVANEYPQTQSLLQAWSKTQVFHRSRLLKRLPFSNISPENEKNKNYSCSVCEPAVSESLLSLRLIAWGLGFRRSPSDRGLRSWWRLPCLSNVQMSGEAVTQLFPLISTCQ